MVTGMMVSPRAILLGLNVSGRWWDWTKLFPCQTAEESRAGLVGGGSMGVHALGLLRLGPILRNRCVGKKAFPWLDALWWQPPSASSVLYRLPDPIQLLASPFGSHPLLWDLLDTVASVSAYCSPPPSSWASSGVWGSLEEHPKIPSGFFPHCLSILSVSQRKDHYWRSPVC